jgi:CRP-like cAMP-binding protein
MFFIVSGEVNTVSGGGDNMKIITEGSSFGEESLLAVTKRTESQLCLTYVETYVLSRDALRAAFVVHPGMRPQLLDNLEKHRFADQKSNAMRSPKRSSSQHRRMPSSSRLKLRHSSSRNNVLGGNGDNDDDADDEDDFFWLKDIRRYWWGTICGNLFLYQFIMVAFNICFTSASLKGGDDPTLGEMCASILLVGWLLDVFFAVDMYLNAYHFVDKGNLLLMHDRKKRLHNYLRGDFTLDLLSTFPLDLLCILGGLRNWKVAYWLRVTKLLRTKRYNGYQNYLILLLKDYGFSIEDTKLRVLKTFWALFMLTHMYANVWFYIAWNEVGSDSWVNQLQDRRAFDPIDGKDIGYWYLRAAYWAFTTMSGTGFGDLAPRTTAETVYALFVQTTAASMYVLLIGAMTSVVNMSDAASMRFEQKMQTLRHYMDHRKIAVRVRKQVLEYYDYMWDKKLGVKESLILADLPYMLRNDMLIFRTSKILAEVHMFGDAESGFIHSLATVLAPVTFRPCDVILPAGVLSRAMYFIDEGVAEVRDPRGKRVLQTMGKGSFFGERALISGEVTEKPVFVSDLGFCESFVLSKKNFDLTVSCYPRMKKKFGDDDDDDGNDDDATAAAASSSDAKSRR